MKTNIRKLLQYYKNKSVNQPCLGGIFILNQLNIEEKLSIKELKIFLGVSDTKFRSIISRLHKSELIKICHDSHDTRKKNVYVSKHGQNFLKTLDFQNFD